MDSILDDTMHGFYLTRIVALTIEPFQDVSGVASIGPHILISLLILIAVIAFNGDERECS